MSSHLHPLLFKKKNMNQVSYIAGIRPQAALAALSPWGQSYLFIPIFLFEIQIQENKFCVECFLGDSRGFISISLF
jgi:hypothetical protein